MAYVFGKQGANWIIAKEMLERERRLKLRQSHSRQMHEGMEAAKPYWISKRGEKPRDIDSRQFLIVEKMSGETRQTTSRQQGSNRSSVHFRVHSNRQVFKVGTLMSQKFAHGSRMTDIGNPASILARPNPKSTDPKTSHNISKVEKTPVQKPHSLTNLKSLSNSVQGHKLTSIKVSSLKSDTLLPTHNDTEKPEPLVTEPKGNLILEVVL